MREKRNNKEDGRGKRSLEISIRKVRKYGSVRNVRDYGRKRK